MQGPEVCSHLRSSLASWKTPKKTVVVGCNTRRISFDDLKGSCSAGIRAKSRFGPVLSAALARRVRTPSDFENKSGINKALVTHWEDSIYTGKYHYLGNPIIKELGLYQSWVNMNWFR